MTRINTNVSSLVAQNTLGRSNASLNQALTRLSTGLRINTGKDDPAGLIASENLRSDITSIRRAISNTDRANQVIATADSALGQVSSLLNDIRGLVTESANAGALSDAQIAANQLQVDSSLEALNRIAQTTTFQGRRLLDGSLDFLTSSSDVDFPNITNLQIDQANLGATGSVNVDIDVTSAATQAQVDVTSIPTATVTSSGTLDIAIGAVASTGDVNLSIAAEQGSATITSDTTGSASVVVDAVAGGAFDGTNFDGAITLAIVDGSSEGVSFSSNTLTVTVDITGGNNTFDDLVTVINNDANFSTGTVSNGSDTIAASNTGSGTASGGVDASTETISVTGAAAGTSGNVSITIAEATGIGTTPQVSGNAGIGYTITVDDTAATTVSAISSAINGLDEVSASTTSSRSFLGSVDSAPAALNLTNGAAGATESISITTNTGVDSFNISLVESTGQGATPAVTGNTTSGYTVTIDDNIDTAISAIASAIQTQIAEVATATTTSTANFNGASDSVPSTLSLTAASTGGLTQAVTLELAGTNGSEVLSFGVGTSIDELVAGFDLVADATGVDATANGTTLELRSTAYGSSAFVDISVIDDDAALFTDARDEGTDVVASINGVAATGDGNELSINTATLDLSATLAADFIGVASFSITGGGALFQLGPDVVTNQQARLGIGSVNTAQLGGASGKLFSLGTGGTNELTSDNLDTAAAIIEEAIDQVTSLRGRLGAFQRTTLETNKNALNDTLINLTDAESTIRDADFAAESAELTRSQILVQSGTAVLQIANSNPQNVLALLG